MVQLSVSQKELSPIKFFLYFIIVPVRCLEYGSVAVYDVGGEISVRCW